MVKHTLRKKRRHSNSSDHRKTRSDKKIDIRVPVSERNREFILWNARSKRQSMTRYATDIVRDSINRNLHFVECEYVKHDFEVHVKAEQELYQHIVNYSVDWNCSIREATFRILSNAIHYIRGGVHIENFQRT